MRKTLSIVLSFCFVISLFACMSGLPVYAIDNTPEPQAVMEKIEVTESSETEAAKSEEEKAKKQEKAAVIKKQTKAAAPTTTTTTAEKKNAATSGTCGTNVTWEYNTSTYTLTISGTGKMSDYSDSYSVPYTTAPWREYYNKMKTVVINSGVTSIGDRAFYDCTKLTSITIGNSVTSIGERAFSGCTGLTSITIPGRVTSIDDWAFYNCTGLKKVNYTGNIADWCNISFGIATANPLQYAHNLYINDVLVTDVVIPDTVKEIKDCAFYKCTSLTSVTIPDSVTSISFDAFNGCKSLTSITIGNSVTSIGNMAFCYCTGLTSITIPDSVTSIVREAFAGCTRLTSITIGNSVTSIGEAAFYGCTGLESIVVANSNKQYHSSGNCLINTESKILIVGCKSSVIPDDGSVTSIGDDAFNGCTGLTGITIPDSVTSIGDDAFRGCSSLKEISLPFVGDKRHKSTDTYRYPFGYIFGTDSYTGGTATTQYYYGKSTSSTTSTTYYIPSSLKKVTITDCDYIPDGAFYNCTGLTSIIIPDSVTSIDYRTFMNCKSLTSIKIPDSVTSIGTSAFDDCTGLKKVNYTGTIADWCNISFSNYDANPLYYAHNLYINDSLVTDLVIPDTVKEIKSYAFIGCKSLTSITIPDSVTSISKSAFSGCTGLTSIIIPDSVISIGYDAFSGCESLTSITIPDSITSIGDYTFYYCTGLTSITIPDSVISIGKYAFEGCTGLKTVYYKGGTESSWAKISIGERNTRLINATRICYFDTCGENVFYNIDNNTLNIVGSGTMDSYKTQASVPWYDQKDNITCVRTDKGVSKIGTYSFNCLSNLKNVIIQNKNADIGKYAFNTNNKNIKVFAESGGNIATYCINNGINYVDPKPQATTKSITSDTITVNAETGFEYSINGTTNWQTEGVFTGLSPVTTYYIYARNKDVLDYFENTSYKPLTVKTVKRTVAAPAAPVCISNTDTKIVLQANSLYEYSIDGIYWQKSNIFTNLTHGKTYSLYQRIAETSTDYASSASEPLTMKLIKKEVSAPAAPDYEAHTENSITLKPNSKYEFSMDGENWQKSNVFTNLSKNTIYRFYQRFAETDTEYVSTSSPALITAIPDKPKVINTSIESITVRQIEGFEYCLDDMVWQKSNVFDMLIEDMEYYVYQRIAAIPGEKVYQITSDYTAVITENKTYYELGDTDGDEEVTDKDATYLLFHLFFPEEYEVNQPLDFNGDKNVDVKDVIHLLFYIYFPKYYKLH